MCTAIPPMSSPRTSHSPVCSPARTWMPSACTHRGRLRGADRTLRAVEQREETVPRCVHLAAPKSEQAAPARRRRAHQAGHASPGRPSPNPARRVHDVGEQRRGENPVVRSSGWCPVRNSATCWNDCARVRRCGRGSPRRLNVLRARDVVGDVLAAAGRIKSPSCTGRRGLARGRSEAAPVCPIRTPPAS